MLAKRYVWNGLLLLALTMWVSCGPVQGKVDTEIDNAFGTAGLHNYSVWRKDWDGQSFIVGRRAQVQGLGPSGLSESDFSTGILRWLLRGESNLSSVLNPQRTVWASLLKTHLFVENLGQQNIHRKVSQVGISFVTFANQQGVWNKALGQSPLSERQLLQWQWQALVNQPDVLWVEPDLQSTPQTVPSEFSGEGMKGLVSAIKLDTAYETIDSRNLTPRFVNVAVLDTGVDYAHPDLKAQMLVNPGENPNGETYPTPDGIDNDGNGYIDDIYGIDASVPPGVIDPFSPGAADVGGPGVACPSQRGGSGESCGHGTHVAGIIAATHSNNGASSENTSAAGICPACKIQSLRASCRKVIGGSSRDCRPAVKSNGTNILNGGILDSSQLRAMDYVLNDTRPEDRSQLRINVLNASIGKYTRSRAMAYKIRELTQAGVIVVAAAGNEGTDSFSYPAAFSSVLAVCATDNAGKKASFSNFGSWVDVCAPGVNVLSTVPAGLEQKSGTSMAAPVVAGLAGLILSIYPTMTPERVIALVKQSANFQALYGQPENRIFENKYADGTVFYQLGSGLIDASAAVQQESQSEAADAAGQLVNSRVKDGCIVSSVAVAEQQRPGALPKAALFFFLLLSLPGLLLCFWAVLRSHKKTPFQKKGRP